MAELVPHHQFLFFWKKNFDLFFSFQEQQQNSLVFIFLTKANCSHCIGNNLGNSLETALLALKSLLMHHCNALLYNLSHCYNALLLVSSNAS